MIDSDVATLRVRPAGPDGAVQAMSPWGSARLDADVPVHLDIEGPPEVLAALLAGEASAAAAVVARGRGVELVGLPPWGTLLEEINARAPSLEGVTTRVAIDPVDPGGTGVLLGVVDGRWAPGSAVLGPSGEIQLLDGLPLLLALLADPTCLSAQMLSSRLRGDLAGLSHLDWMLRNPAAAAAVAPVRGLLSDLSLVLDLVWSDAVARGGLGPPPPG